MNNKQKSLLRSFVKSIVENVESSHTEEDVIEQLLNFYKLIDESSLSNTKKSAALQRINDLISMVHMNPNINILVLANDELNRLKYEFGYQSLIRKTLSVKPEAPADAPFGQYLFAPERTDIGDKVHEPNTTEEYLFLRALDGHYNGSSSNLMKIAPEIIDLVNKGQYKKILSPPNKVAYRLLWNVNPSTAAALLGLSVKNIVEKPGRAWYVNGGGTIKPRKFNSIQSWSIKMDTQWIVDLIDVLLVPGKIAIILAANVNENDFFINPNGAELVLSLPKDLVRKEQEVISVGSVKFFEASFYCAPKISLSNDEDRYDYSIKEETASIIRQLSNVMKFRLSNKKLY